jgi:hypothetical protein
VKGLVAAIVALALTMVAAPAMAYVVVVTTSVPMTAVGDEGQLKTALQSAVDDVLAHAIGFTPTVVTLEEVRVFGNRMYLLLIIADADGEKSIDAFSADERPSAEPAEPSRGVASQFTY